MGYCRVQRGCSNGGAVSAQRGAGGVFSGDAGAFGEFRRSAALAVKNAVEYGPAQGRRCLPGDLPILCQSENEPAALSLYGGQMVCRDRRTIDARDGLRLPQGRACGGL